VILRAGRVAESSELSTNVAESRELSTNVEVQGILRIQNCIGFGNADIPLPDGSETLYA